MATDSITGTGSITANGGNGEDDAGKGHDRAYGQIVKKDLRVHPSGSVNAFKFGPERFDQLILQGLGLVRRDLVDDNASNKPSKIESCGQDEEILADRGSGGHRSRGPKCSEIAYPGLRLASGRFPKEDCYGCRDLKGYTHAKNLFKAGWSTIFATRFGSHGESNG